MYFWLTFLLLFGNWLVFSGKFDPFHLSLGVLSSLLVAASCHELLFKNRQKAIGRHFVEAGRFLPYCLWLLWQIVIANMHVIALAIFRKYREKELDPHIFTFRTKLQSGFARFVLANSITLTPGTVTIRIEDDLFHVHAISRKAAGDLAEQKDVSEMERRIACVFEKNIHT